MITVPDVKNLHELSITEQHHMDESVHSKHDAARTEGRKCPASHWMLRPQRTPNPINYTSEPQSTVPQANAHAYPFNVSLRAQRGNLVAHLVIARSAATWQSRSSATPKNPVYPVHPVHLGKNPSLPPLPRWERVGVRVTASPCHCEERSRSWCACRTTWQSRSG